MGRLLLLRHGRSTWNAESRWQGWADAPLADEGVAQARAMAEHLRALHLGLVGVVASDLARALDTARAIAAALGLGPVAVEPDLRERDVGDWTGRTTEEIDLVWPGAIAAWRAGRLDRPPGGEHEPAFRARVVRAVERLAAEPGGPLLVVSHGGVVRALERHVGGSPPAVTNMSGRWFHRGPDGILRGGEHVALPDVPDERVTAAL